jgi:hypothetical protein
MRRVILWTAALVMAACASETGSRRTTSAAPSEGAGEASGGDADAIPPEKLEEIQDTLRRKQQEISHCWTDEATRTKNRSLEVEIMLKLTIGPQGRATNVGVVKDTIKSNDFEQCVVEMVKSFDFPVIPTAKELTWSYAFKPLY